MRPPVPTFQQAQIADAQQTGAGAQAEQSLDKAAAAGSTRVPHHVLSRHALLDADEQQAKQKAMSAAAKDRHRKAKASPNKLQILSSANAALQAGSQAKGKGSSHMAKGSSNMARRSDGQSHQREGEEDEEMGSGSESSDEGDGKKAGEQTMRAAAAAVRRARQHSLTVSLFFIEQAQPRRPPALTLVPRRRSLQVSAATA